ncbi:MAG: carbohydrate ABC transporter substrate-binding protein [Hungatella sp.]|nr:carbohydrate ABC transporter substrate-binding protein [Hungatella sp.]
MKLMKRVMAAALAASMAASMSACKSQAPAGEAAKTETQAQETSAGAKETQAQTGDGEQVTLRFSWWGGDSRHAATQKAAEAFMAKYPNIKVECEYGAWDGWTEKCATQLNGGTAPDLMQVNWNWLYQFSGDGSAFADINSLSAIDLSGFPENIVNQCVVGGKLQAVPISTTGKCFFWNKTTFEKAGLDTPKTIEDLINAGTVFKEKLGDDSYPLAMYQYERMLLMLYYLEAKYGKEWVVDGAVNYTYDEVKEGLDWICSLEDAHVLPKIELLLGDGATILEKNTKWANGKYAGFYEWDSANTKFVEALEPGQEFVLGDFITGIGEYDAGLTKISQCFAITEASEHKEEAALLLDFLMNDPEGVEIMGTERGIVVNETAGKILVEKDLLKGLTYEANQAVLGVANFTFDPNFENSELKDSTGVYYEVFENISADHSTTGDMAQYLIDEIERVQMENPY